jgi:hypothetical protein
MALARRCATSRHRARRPQSTARRAGPDCAARDWPLGPAQVFRVCVRGVVACGQVRHGRVGVGFTDEGDFESVVADAAALVFGELVGGVRWEY